MSGVVVKQEPESEAETASPSSTLTLYIKDDKGRDKIITTVALQLPFSVPQSAFVDPIDMSPHISALSFVPCQYSSTACEDEERRRQRVEYEKFFFQFLGKSSRRGVQKCAHIRLLDIPASLYLVGPAPGRTETFTANDSIRCYYSKGPIMDSSPPIARPQQHIPAGVPPPPPSAPSFSPSPSASNSHPLVPSPYYSWPAHPAMNTHPSLPPHLYPQSMPPAVSSSELPRARVSSRFLGDLTHQHDWVFGAIAELIHNSRDAGARRITMSIRYHDLTNQPMFVIDDDGRGMTHAEMVRMMQFGGDASRDLYGQETTRIGKFGFGFKHGSMRIGDDAIVLSKSDSSFSVGFLSQSYNKTQKEVHIPILTRVLPSMKLDKSVNDEQTAAKVEEVIKKHSPFNAFTLNRESATIGNPGIDNPTGTRIIIYNLRKSKLEGADNDDDEEAKQREQKSRPRYADDDYELKWCSSECSNDIRLQLNDENMRSRPGQISTDVPLDHSLRAYCELMFLDKQCIIDLQGKDVLQPFNPDKQLSDVKLYPCPLAHFRGCVLTLGFSQREKDRGNCGIHLYWHKTLIEPYTRVGLLNSDRGLGCIGVFDVGQELLPKNTKQGFPTSSPLYIRLLKWLAEYVKKYIYEVQGLDLVEVHAAAENLAPQFHWVQCEKCKKWRRITPAESATLGVDSKWYCYMNKDPTHNTCDAKEEAHDASEVTVNVSEGAVRQQQPSATSLKRRREDAHGSLSNGIDRDGHEDKQKQIKNHHIAPQQRQQSNGPAAIHNHNNMNRNGPTNSNTVNRPKPSSLSNLSVSDMYPRSSLPATTSRSISQSTPHPKAVAAPNLPKLKNFNFDGQKNLSSG